MTDHTPTRADGGVVPGAADDPDDGERGAGDDDRADEDRADAGSRAADEGEGGGVLDVDLPEDSLFTLDDYLEMYAVASSEPAFAILCALDDRGRLSASELSEALDREGNELHYYLRKLKRVALVQNRRDPNTGTAEAYSYYTLTDPGRTVLEHGLKTGIEKLAAEETAIRDRYQA